MRRKSGKMESTRNVTLEEREFQEDRRIKRKKKNVRKRMRERLSGGGRKDYEGLNSRTITTTRISLNHYF